MRPSAALRRSRAAQIDAALRARRRLRGERRAAVRPAAPGRLRVADVALFYGERSGGIRTYLDNKVAWARETTGIEHHLIVPGPKREQAGGRHELPSFRVAWAGVMPGAHETFGLFGFEAAAPGTAPERHLHLVRPPARGVAAAGGRRLAVAIHDVAPSTYERCALMRDWLEDHGVDRVTLLVIPAPDLHPFQDRRPELASWLRDRAAAGDAVAQHGLQHRQARRGTPVRQALAHWQGREAAEFVGLDAQETRRAVESGRRLLKLAGVEPRGFVAPGYAYTPSLRDALAGRFDWWADLLRLHRGARAATLSPALTLGTTTPFKRALSPLVIRAMSVASGPLLRLDLHPADLDHSRHMRALDAVLKRAGRRTAVTYDDLCAA